MEISLKNVGKISSASVTINGITVIAGENNTGKSTIGKALYSVFNSFFNIDERVYSDRGESVSRQLETLYRFTTNRLSHRVDTHEIAAKIVDNIDFFGTSEDSLKAEILDAFSQHGEILEARLNTDKFNTTISQIIDKLRVPNEAIFTRLLNRRLYSEFSSQINNVYSEDLGEIQLCIQGQCITIKIKDNVVVDVDGRIDLHTEAVYIDDPFVLDDVDYSFLIRNIGGPNHRVHLQETLFLDQRETSIVDEIIVDHTLENIYSKIATICDGNIVRYKTSGLGYKRADTDKVVDVRNLSAGLKSFVILKQLLLNGALDYNGTIILDEPEIHLHPEWQLLFAELIVLLYKEFNLHVLLNTHSPYFLRAIQVYSAKHEVADKCKYYLSEASGDTAYITDVSDNIEKVYSKLSEPFQKLENERWQDD